MLGSGEGLRVGNGGRFKGEKRVKGGIRGRVKGEKWGNG